MDKDLLRRQIVDEIQAEFDTKLRQAKRQRNKPKENWKQHPNAGGPRSAA